MSGKIRGLSLTEKEAAGQSVSMFKFTLIFSLFLSFMAPNLRAQTKLPDGVVSIGGADPTLPDSELAPLIGTLVQSAPIVAIGESVHGSSNYLKMEHRISRYLVERHGFRLIILENPVIRSAGLTQWVNDCPNDTPPVDLLYMPVTEDVDFFRWICAFNRLHPLDPIRFRGMDIWDRPWEHQDRIEKISESLKLGFEKYAKATQEHCWLHRDSNWSRWAEIMDILKRDKHIPEADFVPCMDALRQMNLAITKMLRTSQGARRYALFTLLQSVDSAAGYQKYLNAVFERFGFAWNARDFAQSLNERSIFEQEGRRRAVLIAHTSHTAKMDSLSDWWKLGVGEVRSGISFMRRTAFGQQVRTIGLTGYHVTGTQGDFTLPTSSESLDLKLHELGVKTAFINPFKSYVTSRDRWWVQNENTTDTFVDGVYMVPKENFDAFFFFDETLKGKPVLPWRDTFNW